MKRHIKTFLAKQVNPPPLLFFSLYVYNHLQVQISDYTAYALFVSGLLFAILFKYNHFYLYSPIINGGIGYWSVLNLFIGVLASNEKWKLYLYFFVIGDSLTLAYPQISSAYLVCAGFYISVEIYRNLIFRYINHNVMYFVGFFTVFVFELFQIIMKSLSGYTDFAYFTIPFALIVSYKLITIRVNRLKMVTISQLRDVQVISHYINLIREEIVEPHARLGHLQTHKIGCHDSSCFCKNDYLTQGQISKKFNFSTKVEYFFIRHLYETAFKSKGLPQREFLYNKFITFLIENNQVTQAIELYYKLDSLSQRFIYFRWIERVRILQQLKAKIKQSDYFNVFSQEFQYVFKYDNSYLTLAAQIKEILKEKVQFWKEVGKQSPLMVKLEQMGTQIVEKMYNLNVFYYKQIKEQQNKINNFNGTIIYSMYLLSTTNYKQFAQSLIKNTSRTLQSIKIHEDNIAQTYGIRVLIRDIDKSCNEKIQEFQTLIQEGQIDKLFQVSESEKKAGSNGSISKYIPKQKKKQYSEFIKDGFIQVIVNISGSLCKLLKTQKNSIMGKELSTVIPNSYQQRHHAKLQKLLHSRGRANKQLLSHSFINRTLKVPLRTQNDRLLSAKVTVKVFHDFHQGISFVALVQTINENKVAVMVNLHGDLLECQEGLTSIDLIKSNEMQNVIASLKQQWDTHQCITTKKLSLNYNDINYSISFSSPYQTAFIDNQLQKSHQKQQQCEQQKNSLINMVKPVEKVILSPPIHIDIINEQIPFAANQKVGKQQQMTKCIRKMQSVFVKGQTDSQASTSSSRKSSVVNVLMSFSENYFIPFYNYIMIIFGLMLVAVIVGDVIAYAQFSLPWTINSQMKNPIINVLSLMDIRKSCIQTINHQMDLLQYNQNSLLNKTNINLFYGLQDSPNMTYAHWVMTKGKIIQSQFRSAVIMVTMYVADILSDAFNTAYQVQVYTLNPGNSDTSTNWQNLSITSIFMAYMVDIDILSIGKSYSKTIISRNFWAAVEYILSQTDSMQQIISETINKTITYNIVFLTVFSILICVSIIPINALLRKRVKRHIDIYDLIASVEGEMIHHELKKLQSIITIVNNSNQSSQMLKTNTINYLARKRSAVNMNKPGSNQMIQGLLEHKNNDITSYDNVLEENLPEDFKMATTIASHQRHSSSDSNNKQQHQGLLNQEHVKIHLRKRSGQLDLLGSQADPKKIVGKHFLLYFMIVISLFSVFGIIIQKMSYFSDIDQLQIRINQINNNMINDNLLTLNAKMFFRGMKNFNLTQLYHGSTFIDWLAGNIYNAKTILYQDGLPNDQLYSPCVNTSSMLNARYLFCQKGYSMLTMRQQISQYIQRAYDMRLALNQKYNLTLDNMTFIPASQLSMISENFFYIQTLSDRIQDITTMHLTKILQDMYKKANDMDQRFFMLSAIGIAWSGVCLLIGLFIINHMKKIYFKEIIIVSFLNTQMINSNKRVESFLQALSKSSY